jgi:hypothetical protein
VEVERVLAHQNKLLQDALVPTSDDVAAELHDVVFVVVDFPLPDKFGTNNTVVKSRRGVSGTAYPNPNYPLRMDA